MKNLKKYFDKVNSFTKEDSIPTSHLGEEPLYEFSKKVFENNFGAEIYPSQNGASIKIIINETEKIINVDKDESFQLKFGLIGAKLDIENLVSNQDKVRFDFSVRAVVGVGFLSKKIKLFEKPITMKKRKAKP